MNKERNVISLKIVKLHTRIKDDFDSPFHNILLTTSYFRSLSSKLPQIHIGFKFQQRQKSLTLKNSDLEHWCDNVAMWAERLALKDPDPPLPQAYLPLFLFNLSVNEITLYFGTLLKPAVFLRSECGQDNVHLFHVFEGSVFVPHLDNFSYTKKQFLNEVKDTLTTDKLLGSIFSKAFLFFWLMLFH